MSYIELLIEEFMPKYGTKLMGVATLVMGMCGGLHAEEPQAFVWDFSSKETLESVLPPGTEGGERAGKRGALLAGGKPWQLEFSTKDWPRSNAIVAFVEMFDELDPKESSTPLAGGRSWNRFIGVELRARLEGNVSQKQTLRISGRPDSPEAFRSGQWRGYVAVLFPRSRPVDPAVLTLALDADSRRAPGSPALVASVRVKSIPPERLKTLEQWDAGILKGYLRQLELTLEAGRLEERAKQIGRALFYAGEDDESDPLIDLAPEKMVPVLEKLPGVLKEWEVTRDALYWEGRMAVIEGQEPEVESLRARDSAAEAAVRKLLAAGETELGDNAAGLEIAELETRKIPDALRNLPPGEAWNSTPRYFRDRVRFLYAITPREETGRIAELLGMDAAFMFRSGMVGDSWSPDEAYEDTRDPSDPLVQRMADLEQPGEGIKDPWKEDILENRKFLAEIKGGSGLEVIYCSMFLHNVNMLGRNLPPGLTRLDNTFARPYSEENEPRKGGALNLWSEDVRRYVVDQSRAFGRLAAQSRGNLAAFNTFNEMRWDKPVFVAYNPEVTEAFRLFLRERFESLDALNALLGTKHGAWDDIHAPPPPKRDSFDPQPLAFLWMEFRWKCFADYGQLVYDEFKKESPETPVWYETLTWIPDIAHVHTRTGSFSNLMNYNIRRVYGKTIADSETGAGGYPEYEWDATAEQVAAAAEQDLMDAMMMSQRGLTFWHRFFTANSTGYYSAFHNDPNGNPVIAPRNLMRSAVLRDKADRYGELFLKAEIAGDGVGIVDAGSAMRYVYPAMGHEERWQLGIFLRRGYQPFFVNADDLLRGLDDLKQFRLLFFTSSPYVSGDLPVRVREWIREGGIACFSGMWGLATPLGQPQTQVLAEAFSTEPEVFPPADPGDRAAITEGGRWDWRYNLASLAANPKAEVLLKDPEGRPLVVSIAYGEGTYFRASPARAGKGRCRPLYGFPRRGTSSPNDFPAVRPTHRHADHGRTAFSGRHQQFFNRSGSGKIDVSRPMEKNHRSRSGQRHGDTDAEE